MPSGNRSKALDGIRRVDDFLGEIFQGLRMEAGSICRIASKYLSNWGISVEPEDFPQIEAMSRASSLEDWEGGSPEMHFAIENAIQKAGLSAGNNAMNLTLANMAVPIMGSMISGLQKGNMLNIFDVGAGNGDTTSAILDLIGSSSDTEGMEERCRFCLLEPSHKKVNEIGAMLENKHLKPRYTIVVSTLEEYLEGYLMDGILHMVVSSAVFHHMSTASYLGMIHRKMADEGVLVVGDWYVSTWSRPAFLIPILTDLGANEDTIGRYHHYFKINNMEEAAQWNGMTPLQRTANDQMREYIKCLSQEITSVRGPKIKIFEAHRSLESHHDDVKNAGFCLDMAELRDRYGAFLKVQNNIRPMYSNSEIACVYAAAKIPKKAAAPRTQ